MKNQEKYHRTMLVMVSVLILVGFVPTGLRLFAMLDESTSRAGVQASVPVTTK